MDWKQVKQTPKYNPWAFKLARKLDGLEIMEAAERAGMNVNYYSDIEHGNVAATDEDVKRITASQTHVIETFFEEWFKTELDFSGPLVRSVPIDYYQYKIFREMNPVPMTVYVKPVVIEKPTAKILSMEKSGKVCQ